MQPQKAGNAGKSPGACRQSHQRNCPQVGSRRRLARQDSDEDEEEQQTQLAGHGQGDENAAPFTNQTSSNPTPSASQSAAQSPSRAIHRPPNTPTMTYAQYRFLLDHGLCFVCHSQAHTAEHHAPENVAMREKETTQERIDDFRLQSETQMPAARDLGTPSSAGGPSTAVSAGSRSDETRAQGPPAKPTGGTQSLLDAPNPTDNNFGYLSRLRPDKRRKEHGQSQGAVVAGGEGESERAGDGVGGSEGDDVGVGGKRKDNRGELNGDGDGDGEQEDAKEKDQKESWEEQKWSYDGDASI